MNSGPLLTWLLHALDASKSSVYIVCQFVCLSVSLSVCVSADHAWTVEVRPTNPICLESVSPEECHKHIYMAIWLWWYSFPVVVILISCCGDTHIYIYIYIYHSCYLWFSSLPHVCFGLLNDWMIKNIPFEYLMNYPYWVSAVHCMVLDVEFYGRHEIASTRTI